MFTFHKETSKNVGSKKIYIEALRVIAIFFVIFNHTGVQGFFLFSEYPFETPQFWCYLIVSIFCKFAVPIFFAISGALLLCRDDEALSILWKKRIVKIVITLLVISIIYGMATMYLHGYKLDIHTFFVMLYSSNLEGHLWYLYAYIAYLVSIPFLKAMVQNLKKQYFYYMIGIVFFFDFLYIIEHFLWSGTLTLNVHLKVSWILSSVVIYPCVGYFLEHRIDINQVGKKLPILWGGNLLCMILSSYATYCMGKRTGTLMESTSQWFHNSFVLINCMTIFLTLKYLFKKVNVKPVIGQVICSIGECTFGIYLLHILIKEMPFARKFLDALLNIGMNHMVAIWIYIFVVLLCCWIVTWILKKIPGIRSVVGG